MAHDIAKLEQRMVTVDQKIKRLESLQGLLGPITHRPGWTTLAEYKLVILALDALEGHVDRVSALQSQLVSAAKLVGQTSTGAEEAA
jgi:hypothetical protein